jgi:ribosomal protein S18 acetylase RimI-like enzyme
LGQAGNDAEDSAFRNWIVMDKSYFRLRKDLVEPPQAPRLPFGIGLVPFDADKHAAAARDLLEVAYRSGGGSVAPFASWWPEVEADPEYDPATIFIAADLKGGLVDIAFCWRVPFVKDLAVAPAWQRQGVGEALLRQAFVCFHQRGASHIDLKVHVHNPALRLYRRLGMRPV